MESDSGMHWFSLRLQGEIETARTTILTNQVQLCVFDILPGSFLAIVESSRESIYLQNWINLPYIVK